ncbi:hypothetical protein EDD90_3017 [Streptomyces sp. Ag109_O5-1]|nr:hypothetical protein EDD90_3017 [Streptomyces sp. Ag109_O5-1]
MPGTRTGRVYQAEWVAKTQAICYTSTPVYANDTNPLPEEIDITALGTGGFKSGRDRIVE